MQVSTSILLQLRLHRSLSTAANTLIAATSHHLSSKQHQTTTMSSSKRALDANDPSISPPPSKRKLPNNTTKAAVANFFTPTSQKPKVVSPVNWSERSVDDDTPPTLLVGRYDKDNLADDSANGSRRRTKIAAFDLDGTLIKTASGKQFSDDPLDWRWWHPKVPGELQQLYQKGYRVVILSNQAGINLRPDPKNKAPKVSKRLPAWKQKLNAVLAQLDIPISVYAATGQDIFRKPRSGMWKEVCDDYDLTEQDVDMDGSFFIGDAGGRTIEQSGQVKDFSCSDRNFAHNVGINYKTPEEHFLDESPRKFQQDLDFSIQAYWPQAQDKQLTVFQKGNDQEIVLFCGSPGAGKSSFFQANLKDLGYKRVNQDILKTREKCMKAAQEYLAQGESVCVDNTNADVETRAHWVNLAKKHQMPIRCVWFKTSPSLSEHNNAARAMNKQLNFEARELVPKIAFGSYAKRFKEPKVSEGFAEVIEHEFVFVGTKEDYAIWAKYWA